MKKKIIGIGSIVVLLIIGCVFYFTREEEVYRSYWDCYRGDSGRYLLSYTRRKN